jgi:hypothetical protein
VNLLNSSSIASEVTNSVLTLQKQTGLLYCIDMFFSSL